MSIPAQAVPTAHEITATWSGDPAPTEAPFGEAVTVDWRINTNDVDDPFSNDPVDNVRATLTASNGVFTSIPSNCKTTGVTPISEISADGTVLTCNIGTVKEGTASVVQTPVRATAPDGGDLTVTGTATSDTAAAEAGPADPGPLPITYSHGMDISLVSAPGITNQGFTADSRTGGKRIFLQMNYSVVLTAGSRPGPDSYSFPVTVGTNVLGADAGLQWENCVPVSSRSTATGQPFSDPAQPDRTNFPGCSVNGSGNNYTVSLSGLDYTLANTPANDSLGQPLPGTGSYIASGTVQFSIPAPVGVITNFTFDATPGSFTFTDGTVTADADATNNGSDTTLTPPGSFSNYWLGVPAFSRAPWDTNLWVSPGTGQDEMASQLYMQVQESMWNGYTGPGGDQMAGICTMNQNPDFIVTSLHGEGWTGTSPVPYQTAQFFYTTQAIDTKTETCGEPAPSAKWVEVPNDSLLPAGVTAVKMTWNPAVDQPQAANGISYLVARGYVSPTAPTSGEGWTTGAVRGPLDPSTNGFPSLNGWTNPSTAPGGTDLPGSTYGPNMNGYRDAFRLQGPQGLITKEVSDTTAQPGVPITYTLKAQAQNTVTSPPPASFDVVDTLPVGMEYIPGSADPAPASVSPDGRVLTWSFAGVEPNVFQTIRYEAQTAPDSTVAPGTSLTNMAVINVPGDNRPPGTPGRIAYATVVVPSASATIFGKSVDANVLSFEGDSSAWELTINSQDPVENPFTDTIDILPALGDGRGTDIDGTYSITGVDAPAGSTVYYTTAPFASLSDDPRDASNGGTPGSTAGNTVGWSTTAVANPTAIRVVGPALAPGATQTIRIDFTTPAGSSCEAPAAGDNKPGQVLVNSASSFAGHTALPMLSSATTEIGSCYAVNLKKYVQDADGVWHDANTPADYPTYHVGDQVPYRIVVENVGQGTVTDLEITDDLFPSGSFTVDDLPRGEQEIHEFTETITGDGAVVNTACATAATPPDADAPTINCDPAGITIEGEPTHTKSLISATPIGNGEWELVYGIEVTNLSIAATSYSLTDTLHFTDQATIVSADVTGSPAGVTLATPAWDGQGNVAIADVVPLAGNDDAGYAPHEYELTVVAEVPLELTGAGSGADDPTVCGPEGDDADRAFNNTSEMTDSSGAVEEGQACAPIPSISVDKGVSSGPTPNGDGTWTVTYDIVATNSGDGDGVYDVVDRMTADGDITVDGAQVVTVPTGVTASASWTGLGTAGAPENVIASDVPLAAGGTHTYQVEVVIGLADGTQGAPVITDCSAVPGETGGLSNSAEIEHNDLTADDSACVTVGAVTVDKTVSAGPTPNGDGTWTVVYDIVAENVGAASADYDVTDRLHFGDGIDVVSADVITTPSGVSPLASWTGLGATQEDPENLIASDVPLDAGDSHTYQVEVVVQMDEETIDPAVLACPPPGTGADGGLANSTSVISNGITAQDEVCPSLPLIDIDKTISAGPTANGDGTWTITYDLVASNTGQAEGDYDLVDQLQYGDGVVVESADVVTAPDGVTVEAGWTGQGGEGSDENVVATGVTLGAGASHTYQVQAVVSLNLDVATPETLACPAPGEAGGLANTTELTHNGETFDDDACAPLPLISITKSLSGAVTPVAGQDGVYDVTYEITATNTGEGAGVYNLEDELAPGDGVTIVGIQDVTTDAPAPVGLNPGYDGVADTRVVTAQPIDGAVDGTPVVHTYLVTVRYSADLTDVEVPVADACTTDDGTVAGGLNNVAAVIWNGIEGTDDECIRPGKPTIDKALVSATPVGDGQWEVVYDLTVGNVGTEATTYDLDDELLFAPVITVDSVVVTGGPEGASLNDAFDGADDQRIATDVPIGGLDDEGYAPHVYTVTVVANVPLHFEADDIAEDGTGSPACTVPAGSNFTEQGLNNAATLTDETGGTVTDTDCAPVPSIDITKSVVGHPVKGDDGAWTVTYDIVATNDGAAEGIYTLTDRLRFGAGLDVTSAQVASTPDGVTASGTWTGQGAEGDDANVIATDVALAAGGVHTYRVVVVADLDTGAADTSTFTCPEPGSGEPGGFSNVAGIGHNGLADTATACDTPDEPGTPGTPGHPDLPRTGAEISGAVGAAAFLLLLGGTLVFIRRRRLAEATR